MTFIHQHACPGSCTCKALKSVFILIVSQIEHIGLMKNAVAVPVADTMLNPVFLFHRFMGYCYIIHIRTRPYIHWVDTKLCSLLMCFGPSSHENDTFLARMTVRRVLEDQKLVYINACPRFLFAYINSRRKQVGRSERNCRMR